VGASHFGSISQRREQDPNYSIKEFCGIAIIGSVLRYFSLALQANRGALAWIPSENPLKTALGTQLKISGVRGHRTNINGPPESIMPVTKSLKNGCKVHAFYAVTDVEWTSVSRMAKSLV
jgi:hypothetical protein